MSIHKIYADYEDANDHEAIATIGDAYRAVGEVLREAGYTTCGDDRAEYLVEAIARYLKACNP